MFTKTRCGKHEFSYSHRVVCQEMVFGQEFYTFLRVCIELDDSVLSFLFEDCVVFDLFKKLIEVDGIFFD